MALQSKQRWMLYMIALALTLAAVFYDDEQSPSVANAAVVKPVASTVPAAVVAQALPLDKLHRQAGAAPSTDPFASRSWEAMEAAENAKNAPPPPPPKPQAPPLPYAYMGKMIEGDQTVVFLSARDRNYVARVGDTLDGVWQVVAIQDERMSFDYVPLKMKQHLSFAGGGGGGRAPSRAPRQVEEEIEDAEEESEQ